MEFSQLPSPAKEATPAAPEAAPKAEAKATEQAAPAAAAPAKTEQMPNAIQDAITASRKKFKVDGQEIELSEEEQVAAIQKAMKADKEIKRAVQMEKATKILVEKLKSKDGLKEVLSDPAIGADWKKLAIELVKEQMEDEAMDPRDRELREYRKREEMRQQQEEEAKAQAEEARKAEIRQQTANMLRNEIITALEATPDIPKSAATMDRMIMYMRAAYKANGKIMSAQEAAQKVRSEMHAEMKSFFSATDFEKISEILGPEAAKKIKDAELAKFKKENGDKISGDGKKPKFEMPVTKKGRIRERDFNKNFKNIIAGL